MNTSAHEYIVSMLFWCSFIGVNFITLLTISLVCKCIMLLNKNVNLKFKLMKNYDIKPPKKKSALEQYAQSAYEEAIPSLSS